MNSAMIINIARKGEGFKGWYLNKTLGGKCILRTALSKQFGKRKQSFENGVAKYERKLERGVETRYISSKFKPFLSKVAVFNDDGKKTSQSIFYQNPDNPRERTNIIMHDYPRMGKRAYSFDRLSYNEETKGWNLDYKEQTTMKYNGQDINVKRVINDYIAKTNETTERTFAKKQLQKPDTGFFTKISDSVKKIFTK